MTTAGSGIAHLCPPTRPALGNITTKVFAVNFADDEFYRDSLAVLQRDIPKVAHARLEIRPVSAGSAGHFTMTHPRLWRDQVAAFMAWPHNTDHYPSSL